MGGHGVRLKLLQIHYALFEKGARMPAGIPACLRHGTQRYCAVAIGSGLRGPTCTKRCVSTWWA